MSKILYKRKLLVSEEGTKISCAKERMGQCAVGRAGDVPGQGEGFGCQKPPGARRRIEKRIGNVC